MTSITVKQEFTIQLVDIEGNNKIIKTTKQVAEILYESLGQALGKDEVKKPKLHYPDGVRGLQNDRSPTVAFVPQTPDKFGEIVC